MNSRVSVGCVVPTVALLSPYCRPTTEPVAYNRPTITLLPPY
jgi:hypothetical protein